MFSAWHHHGEHECDNEDRQRYGDGVLASGHARPNWYDEIEFREFCENDEGWGADGRGAKPYVPTPALSAPRSEPGYDLIRGKLRCLLAYIFCSYRDYE